MKNKTEYDYILKWFATGEISEGIANLMIDKLNYKRPQLQKVNEK